MKRRNRPRIGIVVANRGLATADALWWCGGTAWGDRDYRVCFIVPHTQKLRAVVAELRGDTPRGLQRQIREEGLRAPSLAKIATLCESAPRSPRPSRRKPLPPKEPPPLPGDGSAET